MKKKHTAYRLKKTLMPIYVFCFLFLTTSCKKNYLCSCTVVFNNTSGTTSTTFKNTKKEATNLCNALGKTTATQTITCALN